MQTINYFSRYLSGTYILMRDGIESQNVLTLLECHSWFIYRFGRAKVLVVWPQYVIIYVKDHATR
jgi:hypothetical protein